MKKHYQKLCALLVVLIVTICAIYFINGYKRAQQLRRSLAYLHLVGQVAYDFAMNNDGYLPNSFSELLEYSAHSTEPNPHYNSDCEKEMCCDGSSNFRLIPGRHISEVNEPFIFCYPCNHTDEYGFILNAGGGVRLYKYEEFLQIIKCYLLPTELIP